jgi:RimJ/RimL family protein N-acetyltransferase
MDTALETDFFEFHWSNYLALIEKVAYENLKLHKIYTYAFDLRPHLYPVLTANNYRHEARLHEHGFFNDHFIDVLIHSKINPHIKLREAVMEDAQITFDWANNPSIRMHSINKNKIEFDSHLSWFGEKVNSSNCIYLIAEKENQPVGSIRFDINEKNCAVISYLLDPNFHGMGLGKVILLDGIRFLTGAKKVSKISGFVYKENIPSMKSFENLGFRISQDNGDAVIFEKEVLK